MRRRTHAVAALVLACLSVVVATPAPPATADGNRDRAFCASLAREFRDIRPKAGAPSRRDDRRIHDALIRAARSAPPTIVHETRKVAEMFGKWAVGRGRSVSPTDAGLRYPLASGTLSLWLNLHCNTVFG